jgi:exopolysaccharide biosynthesis protein
VIVSLMVLVILGLAGWILRSQQTHDRLTADYQQLLLLQQQTTQELASTSATLTTTQAELTTVKSEDQFVKNRQLETEIKQINDTFRQAVASYEALIKLRDSGVKTSKLDGVFTQIVLKLAQRNYGSASAQLSQLGRDISTEEQKLAASIPIPANVPAIKEAPASGYRRQSVETEFGTFLVDVIAADLNSTRVQVETASASDCRDNCPVASLADFVSRSGGFAGINGPYFCPAEYPSCAGKTNSFDTLLMNKSKTYFNSDNNVYSTVPAVIFSGNSARFVGQSLEWGRDTGVDAVIASQPLLLSGGTVRFGGDGDPKKGSRGSRSFIGSKDNTVYIGVVRGATVAEVAFVLKTMGLQNALNLDSGGSTALISNGRYLAGPGRNTPFGIVLVRK